MNRSERCQVMASFLGLVLTTIPWPNDGSVLWRHIKVLHRVVSWFFSPTYLQLFLVGYPPVAFYLNKAGRPIVLSCEYPAYQRPVGPWWRHQMETFSALLAICAENSPVSGEFPAQRPVTRSFDVFFDLRLNKRLSKQSWGWWLETPLCPLWRHSNGTCPDEHSQWRLQNS